MDNSEDRKCFVCSKHRGDFKTPGGVIFEDNLLYASHAISLEGHPTVYLGWLVIEPKRHITGLSDLSDEEAQLLGLLVAHLSRSLKTVTGADHVYLFVVGHHVAHLHLHLIARYPGTPREYWGMRIDEWPDAPRGSDPEITDLCNRLRSEMSK